jgi:hypothetical protein
MVLLIEGAGSELGIDDPLPGGRVAVGEVEVGSINERD